MAGSDPDPTLSEIARRLTRSTNVYSDALTRIAQPSANLDAIMREIAPQLEIERKLFGSANAILDHIKQLDAIPSSIESIVNANSGFARMVESISAENTSLTQVFKDQNHILDTIAGTCLSDSVTAAFARIDAARMLSTSLAAQTKLENLDNLTLGQLAGLDTAVTNALTINLEKLTSSYRSLIHVAATDDSLRNSLPFITTFPPVEYYRELDVLESFTIGEVDEATDEAIHDSITASLPSADDLLAALDGRLCQLLHGARQSLKHDNPDRARHVTTSVRELFTQVLHALAPDDQVRQWTSDPNLFHNGRPTRRAKLLFVARSINCDPLARFVEDDVRAALSFVESLNSGTHVVESKLSHAQLSSIVSRMESLLVFLLQLRNHGRG